MSVKQEFQDCIPDASDPTVQERQLPYGSNLFGQCVRCKRHFLGDSAFDKHQVLRPETRDGVFCLDPASRGLIVKERRGAQWWARPGTWAGPNGKEDE